MAWNPDGDLLAIVANNGRTGRITIVDRAGRQSPSCRRSPAPLSLG